MLKTRVCICLIVCLHFTTMGIDFLYRISIDPIIISSSIHIHGSLPTIIHVKLIATLCIFYSSFTLPWSNRSLRYSSRGAHDSCPHSSWFLRPRFCMRRQVCRKDLTILRGNGLGPGIEFVVRYSTKIECRTLCGIKFVVHSGAVLTFVI
jgi:hypothetical protein